MSDAQGVPTILVINLERDRARWESLSTQLRAQGLPCERVPAVEGRQLAAADARAVGSPEVNRRDFFRALVPSEIGCYASHVSCARRLLAGGESAAVVMEDDAFITDDFAAVLRESLPLSAEFDVIKFYDGRARGRELRKLGVRHALVRYRRISSGAVAYLLSARGARKLLANAVPGGRPFDVQFKHWWQFDLEIAGVTPNLVTHPHEFESSIGLRKHLDFPWDVRLRRVRYKFAYALTCWWHEIV